MNDGFIILVDSHCDLTEEIRTEYDLEFIGETYLFNGQPRICDLTWNHESRAEFYESLRKNPESYKTAPPNIAQYQAEFEKYSSTGKKVILFTMSRNMSSAYKFALQARMNIKDVNPEACIEIIDFSFSAALGLMAVNASDMRKNGVSFDEVVERSNASKACYHQMGYLDDLAFTAKTGRINNSAAFFGTLIGIKPLGDIDANGMTTIVGKAKGEKKAYEAILKYIEKTIVNPQEQTVILCNSFRDKNAVELEKLFCERIKVKKILRTNVFPACGIHIGSGLVAFYYMGKPSSENLANEKSIMGEILS